MLDDDHHSDTTVQPGVSVTLALTEEQLLVISLLLGNETNSAHAQMIYNNRLVVNSV